MTHHQRRGGGIAEAGRAAMTDPQYSDDRSGVRLVVGGSRGIGLALVEAQLADESVRLVIATQRTRSAPAPLERLAARQRLQRIELDVTMKPAGGFR
jgi:NAD(P)-dependent dehydrogenase (short-subunit alcohol dehydrogenase family)